MKVLLSIKPQYADKIFNGTKVYEYRRAIFKNPDVRIVVVYSSSPVKKVIGEFEIDKVITQDVKTLWGKTKKGAGITEKVFYKYFGNKVQGSAIKIKSTKLYGIPKCIREDYALSPPQSFLYLF